MTTLADIRSKIRLVTARPSTDQLTDDQIDTYINTYYLYDLPESMRLLNLRDHYTFTTNPNVDTYAFERNSYISVNQPAYVGGYQMMWYQDSGQFFRSWPKLAGKELVATGDGSAGPYTFTISGGPFLRSNTSPIGSKGTNINLIITANTSDSIAETVYDDGLGGFENAVGGTIDYVSGLVTNLTFSSPITAGVSIFAEVSPYATGRPTSILFAQDQFTLRPVPDCAYVVQMEAYRTPTALALDTDNPELNEWWQLLSYGAALKIFTDFGDFEQLQAYRGIYEEQLLLMQRRTLRQYAEQRVATLYSPALDNGMPYGCNY